MTPQVSSEQWLLVSDVDDTLTGDEAALVRLMEELAALRASGRLVVAYNSSRPCASLRRTLRELPALHPPDFLIGALGTEIELGTAPRPLGEYGERFLAAGWERERVAALAVSLGLKPHPEEFQTAFKASYDVPGPEAVEQMREALAAQGLPVKIIYSGGKNLDLIPAGAGKRAPIEYLRLRLDVRPEQVVVAGDSGNDVDMFGPPFKGIIVGNADADLRRLAGEYNYQARMGHAAGVLEGLVYWGVAGSG